MGKRTIPNASDTGGDLNMIQVGAKRKGTLGNGCQAFREVHSGQVIAIIKHMNSG